jgi:hypothetical protein
MNKLIALLILSATAAQAALVFHLKLDEGATDPFATTVNSAVSANTGVLAGSVLPAWFTTNLPPLPGAGTTAALFFDATAATPKPSINTDYLGLTGQVARTVCAWIKSETTQPATGGGGIIVNYGGGSGGAIGAGRYTFRVTDDAGGANAGRLRLEIQGSGVYGTKDMRDGKWHHVAVAHTNGSTLNGIKLYIDGTLDPLSSSSATVINTVVNTAGPYGVDWVRIGNGGWSTLRGFNGGIDDVRIYDSALTQNDILALIYGGSTPAGAAPLASQSIVLGDTNATATFTVNASGTPPLSYQWKFNGSNLPGQTNLSLTLSPAGPANLGTYSVTVSNIFGSTNVSAALTLATAPVDPPQQVALVGGSALLSVAMPTTSSGYTYQWRRNGSSLPGATDSSYTLASAALGDDSTNYTVAVTLGANSATSAPVRIRVLPVPASAYAALVLGDSPEGYWRFGENNGATVAADQTGFHPGSYTGYLGFELGQPGAVLGDADTASAFSSTLNYVQVPYSAELARTNGFTLEAWARPNSLGARQTLIGSYGGLPNAGYELAIDASGNWVFRTSQNQNPAAPTWNDLSGGAAAVGVWTHVVATFDGAVKRLYTNGVLAGTQTIGFRAAAGIEIRLGAGNSGLAASQGFEGTLDEVAIYRGALSEELVRDHYFLATYGSGIAPSIATQPQNQKLRLGDTNATATFRGTATGSPRMRYQWRKGAVELAGKTTSTLALSPATAADLGSYSLKVTNSAGSATSSNATLTLGTGPIVPAAQAVLAGASATFTLSGMPAYQTYTYQWKHAGTNLPGATTSSLTLANVTAAAAGTYTLVATLGADSAESDPASLTVLPAPTTTYAATVNADAPLGWWKLDDAPGSFTVANAATPGVNEGNVSPDTTLGSEGALLGNPGTAAAFTGYSQGARAGASKIEVPATPTLNPTAFTVECWALPRGGAGTYRSPVTSRNAATGVGEGYLFYAGTDNRWQFWLGTGTGWTTLVGPAVALNEWAHLVGTFDGTTASFYVNGTLVATSATAFAPNYSYGLRIGCGGSENLVGDFFFPGRVDEVAVYDKALAVARVQAHYAAAFQPNAAPRFTLAPLSRDTLAGEAFTFATKVHATPPVSLQWLKHGTNLPGATSAELALTAAIAASAGSYQLKATSGTGTTTGSAATLGVQVGEAVSVNLRGFATPTITGNGGQAGLVRLTNWNEVGLNVATGSATNLLNHRGQATPLAVAWSSGVTRQWGGPITAPDADGALLSGFLEGSSSNGSLTVSGIPANYQAAGYSLYVYFAGPSATAGQVTTADWFGAVSVGSVTNFYHALDLAFWDGRFVRATNTNPADFAPADANYALFTGLSAPSVTATVDMHPSFLTGPWSLSAIQLVANVAPATPVPLQIGWQGGNLVLSWTGNWVLEKKSALDSNPTGWSAVPGATSPYAVPQPLAAQQYYRLRNP